MTPEATEEQVLAVGVHPVQEERRAGHRKQIATAQHQHQGIAPATRCGLRHSRRGVALPQRPAAIRPAGEEDRGQQGEKRHDQERLLQELLGVDQLFTHPRAEDGTGCCADGDHGQKPVASLLDVEVGDKGPELGHDEHAEHPHPQIEYDPHAR
jgi:hypothetical protein